MIDNTTEIKSKKIYSQKEQVQYIIGLLYYKYPKEFQQEWAVKPVFDKAFKSLFWLMSDLMIEWFFPLLKLKYKKPSADATLKLLLWVELLIDARERMIEIMKMIVTRESIMKRIKQGF